MRCTVLNENSECKITSVPSEFVQLKLARQWLGQQCAYLFCFQSPGVVPLCLYATFFSNLLSIEAKACLG